MRLPGPLRAAVGLVASATDEAKHLPDRAIELPMMAVSTALQLSLRAQQRYARLAARGDAVLNRSRPSSDPPPWATFDDPVSLEELRRGVLDEEGLGAESSKLLADIFGVADPHPADTSTPVNGTSTPPAESPPAKSPPAKAPPAKQAAPRKPAAKKASATKAAPAGSGASDGKTVSKPRHTPPSAFDNASDD